MQRAVLFSLAAVLLAFVVETSAQRVIHLTYRPPPQRPHGTPRIYRFRREAVEPLWLYQDDNIDRAPATGDHPYLPLHIDDVRQDPNTRYARSIRYNPNSRLPSFPRSPNPFNPRPLPTRPLLISGRNKRDIQFPQKPKHHDIVLPGWNPHARVQPWQKIRVRA